MFKFLSAGSLCNKKAAKPPFIEQLQQNLTYEKLLEANQATQAGQKAGSKAAQKEDKVLSSKQKAPKTDDDGDSDDGDSDDDDAVDETNEMYHDAIKVKMPQTTTIDTAPATLRNNQNATVDIYDLPTGATTSAVLDAVAQHRPIGVVYAAGPILTCPHGHDQAPVRTIRVRFKHAHSAARLFQIGNQPGLGFFVRSHKATVIFSPEVGEPMAHEEGTRVVVFRGPKEIVKPDNLRSVWRRKFAHSEQTQRIVNGPVNKKGVKEVTWVFHSFYWTAELAHSLFYNEYRNRRDCSVRYSNDPCA